jgi:hypothetical protein
MPRSGRFTPWKGSSVHIVHKAGWALRSVWMDVEGTGSLAITGFCHQTIQSVASHCTAQAVAPEVYFSYAKEFPATSQRIRGSFSVMTAFKYIY